MNQTINSIINYIQDANVHAECAFWRIKGITPEEAQYLGVTDKIQSVLDLLQKVDNITMDILITIKQKSK